MTTKASIFLVSPSAHYPAHNWPNTVALMRALNRKGRRVQTIIFSTGTEPVPSDLRGEVESVFIRTPGAWKRVAAGKWQNRRFGGLMNVCETLACLFKVLKLARRQPNAVLHFIGGSYWVVVLAVLCFRRFRFVYSLYGGMLSGSAKGVKGWLRPCLKKLLQHATATGRLDFTCENEFLREEIAALVGFHVQLIPYAIDDDEELPSRKESRQRLDLPPKEKIILFFGTHRREKDYHTALKGCLQLSDPPLALFVGKVISDNDPRRVVADCRYPKARIVNEFVPEEMAKYYFAAADAVVLSYEANFSRGSGVLIECCRHLRPMIASATPYFSAFLTRYPCGVSYVPGDSASFAAAEERLFSDGASHLPALKQARHDHSWTAVADQYIKLYDGERMVEAVPMAIRPPFV
jgi:glycosyltransferase involved in cell wall biosynthesis